MAKQTQREKLDIFLFQLYLENEIIADYEESVRALFKECKSADERKLISHIISKTRVLSERQINYALRSMALKIIEYAGDDQTAVVAVSMSYDPDSSQAVAHLIKTFLGNHNNITLFTTIPLFLKKLTSFKRCVLIDEFSGTGKTIVQRFTIISKDAEARGAWNWNKSCPDVFNGKSL